MRILIIGAGVTGSVYASYLITSKSRLQKKLKEDVEIKILARGEWYKKIKENGLKINHHIQKYTSIDQIPVINTLDSGDKYDFVLIFLRKTQVDDLIPDLAMNTSKNFVFIGNNGDGAEIYRKSIKLNKIILGFPGVGGSRENDHVNSVHGNKPLLTIGSGNNKNRKPVGQLKKILKLSKIKTVYCSNMDSWLKYHIALVSPIAAAIYYNGKDNVSLSRNNKILVIMVRAIREGFKSLLSLNYPVKPLKLFFMMAFPDFIIKNKIKKLLSSEMGKLLVYDHCHAAPEEMEGISMELLSILKNSTVKKDNLDKLFSIFSK